VFAGVLVGLALLVFTAWQATQVRSSMLTVADRLAAASDHLASGESGRASSELAEARDAAQIARRHTRGPVWWLGSRLPWIGDDVTAVRVVSEVAHDLTHGTLPELVEIGGSFGQEVLRVEEGRIDLAPIAEVAPALTRSAKEIGESSARVNGLETDGLVARIRGPVTDVQGRLRRAAALSDRAAVAATLLPPMLGADQERTYLLVFQNNAELRAQGGMPGAMAIVKARDGKVELVGQRAPADIGTFPDSGIELTAEEEELFTTRVSTYPQDVSFIPDFPRSAELLKQMWEDRQRERLDGVLSIDPVAMSYLLSGTGPLEIDRVGVLTAETATETLLRDVYLQVPSNEEQNRLFAETARRMFDVLRGGRGDARALLEGLARGAGERRLMVWPARPEEQKLIDGTAIAGALPTRAGDQPEVGLYVNDSSADKLSYYLDYEVDVTPRSCSPDGSQVLDVRLSATSTVPEGVALPPSVVGPSTNQVAPGVQLDSYYLYAPVGGRIDEATLDGAEAPMGRYTYRGRQVGVVTLDLQPGETRVVDYEVRTGPGQEGTPRLLTTPAATTTGQGDVGASAC
jgi:hypothetical protein